MNLDDLLQKQKEERDLATEKILNSSESKKLIVSGPGTGKTYIFDKIIKKQNKGKFLVLTFIRKLINDIDFTIGIEDTCKTFHEFAKGLLHKNKGSFNLEPFLTDIIQEDANLLGLDLNNFDAKFQDLDEYGSEISFYLNRGDYYKTLSFNDSVYRVYKLALNNDGIIPSFQQIIIDEYQDFNKLEIEFIKILERNNPILIAGDDDQALYDGRSASSKYIKELYHSDKYKKFSLKYCSRCTKVITNALSFFIKNAQKAGYLQDRINKKYECYLPDKIKENKKYQQIDLVECSTIKTVAKYINSQISTIDSDDVKDSFQENKEYPTVLVIGPTHYLKIVYDLLSKTFSNIQFNPSDNSTFCLIDAYRIILKDEDSNLGWRIIAEIELNEKLLTEIVIKSENNIKIVDLLDEKIVKKYKKIINILSDISNKDQCKNDLLVNLKKLSLDNYSELIEHFKYKEEEVVDEVKPIDKSKPSILLTTYKGAKGLSGGHVFLTGTHNGSLPKKIDLVSEVEIAQFLVAMTRTRKKFHMISNRWFINPVNKYGKFIQDNKKSVFIDWIPSELINNLGYIKSKDIS